MTKATLGSIYLETCSKFQSLSPLSSWQGFSQQTGTGTPFQDPFYILIHRQRNRGPEPALGFCNLKAHPQHSTSSNKTTLTPKRPNLLILSNSSSLWWPIFKYMSLWRQFLFKPPQEGLEEGRERENAVITIISKTTELKKKEVIEKGKTRSHFIKTHSKWKKFSSNNYNNILQDRYYHKLKLCSRAYHLEINTSLFIILEGQDPGSWSIWVCILSTWNQSIK